MPKELEDKLKREARKKGLKGKRANAYVYGTMRKTGWKPKQEESVESFIVIVETGLAPALPPRRIAHVTGNKVRELIDRIKALPWVGEVRSSSAFHDYVSYGFKVNNQYADDLNTEAYGNQVKELADAWCQEVGWQNDVHAHRSEVSMTLTQGDWISTGVAGDRRMA